MRAKQPNQRFSGHLRVPLISGGGAGEHTRTVGLLLDYGAEVNAVGGPFGTALHAAALLFDINSSTIVVLTNLLLESSYDIEDDSGHGTPLYLAALFGNVDCLRLLLDHGGQVNAKSSRKLETALRDAILRVNLVLSSYYWKGALKRPTLKGYRSDLHIRLLKSVNLRRYCRAMGTG
jgi:ankyrin repeat protein